MSARLAGALGCALTLTASLLTPALLAAPAGAAVVVDPIPLPDGPDGTRTTKSLVIGLDGAMLDKIRQADTPNMDALMAAGTSSLAYRYGSASGFGLDPQASTVSGPGWSTVLTGVWPDKHGVRDNSFAGKDYATWPDYLTRAERLDQTISTFAIADWDPIATESAGGSIISDEVDVRIGLKSDSDDYGYTVNDERSADAASRYLAEQDPDLAFVYLGKTDIAGHDSGSASQAFLDALEADDAQIGRMLAAIESRPTYADEDWQIVVTNDHGHTPGGGHGGNSLEERQQFVIAAGGGVPAGPQRADLNVTDIVASVYKHAGLARDPGLDGTPFDEVAPDAFDTLRPQLAPRIDETAIPAGLLGQTHTAPTGWSVDNSAMPSGGMSDWRGWTFATNEFWSSADRGQGREGFVRGRNVIAVADSDEWDDKAHGAGAFDSTLVSPSYDVTGRRTAALDFQTWYQQEAPQVGEISVSFDGGTPQLVKSYTANARGGQHLDIAVPAGATSLQVRFRYTGTNNWYWAIDQVVVTPGPAEPAPNPLTIEANAKSRCINDRAAVIVRARNAGTAAADIRLTTPWGDKKFVKVAPGTSIRRIFSTGKRRIPAASATVAGYVWQDGQGYYDRQSPAYGKQRC